MTDKLKVTLIPLTTGIRNFTLVNNSSYHMTRTAPRALSLQNY